MCPPRAGRSRRLLVLAGAVLAIAALTGCQLGTTSPSTDSSHPVNPAPSPLAAQPWTSTPAHVAAARTALTQLAIRTPQRSNDDYRRAAFGPAWTDTDHNGCNQRDDVLLRDVVTGLEFRVGRQRGCDHDMLAGTWIDPYSGTSVTLTDAKSAQQAPLVQIDHIVALSVAWRDGAREWTEEQRLEFANDLANLVATSGASNQTKSGSDAAAWQPIASAQCGYAVRYVSVKATYSLSVSPDEARALSAMLSRC